MRKIILTKEFLYEEYIVKDKTSREIAKDISVSKSVILKGLKIFNIPIKVSRIGRKHKNKKYSYGEINKTFWGNIKRCAVERNIEFNITPEYIWNLFIKQNRKCKLTGIELVIDFVASDKSRYNKTASLDRIDSNKGYIEGNVQWIHKEINQMKWEFSQERFIELCRLVAAKNCEVIT